MEDIPIFVESLAADHRINFIVIFTNKNSRFQTHTAEFGAIKRAIYQPAQVCFKIVKFKSPVRQRIPTTKPIENYSRRASRLRPLLRQ